MRTGRFLAGACLALIAAAPAPARPPKAPVELLTGYFSPGLTLAESQLPVHGITLKVRVDARGEGQGTLILLRDTANYDEYGDLVTGWETDGVNRNRRDPAIPQVELDCRIEFVKAGAVGRVNEPPTTRSIFRITGPKITSDLAVATEGPGLTTGRLLVHGRDHRVEDVFALHEVKPVVPHGNPVPCHPGCFPAGTPVLVPGGTGRIERLRAGDAVTTIGPGGRPARGVVAEVFTSKNRLVEVKTDDGAVLTTDAQPLCLTDGGFRRAGDLRAGDRIWRWRDGRRAESVVRDVAATGREEPVFNLILGDSAVFVAGDFLARGKPPAEGSTPAGAAATPGRAGE